MSDAWKVDIVEYFLTDVNLLFLTFYMYYISEFSLADEIWTSKHSFDTFYPMRFRALVRIS